MCLKYQWPQLRTHHRYFSSVWKIFQHLYEMLYRVDDFITRPIPRLPDGDNNCLGCTHEICLWQGSPPTKELQHLISECPDQTPLNCTVHLSVLKLYAFRNRAEERGFPKKGTLWMVHRNHYVDIHTRTMVQFREYPFLGHPVCSLGVSWSKEVWLGERVSNICLEFYIFPSFIFSYYKNS